MDVAFVTSPTHVFCGFEASTLDFGCRHLGFMETEVTIFGKDGDSEGESHNGKQS